MKVKKIFYALRKCDRRKKRKTSKNLLIINLESFVRNKTCQNEFL